MTTIDIINRINHAIRAGDKMDLFALGSDVSNLIIEDALRDAWIDLIETAQEVIER
jgi:hypothetical protein